MINIGSALEDNLVLLLLLLAQFLGPDLHTNTSHHSQEEVKVI